MTILKDLIKKAVEEFFSLKSLFLSLRKSIERLLELALDSCVRADILSIDLCLLVLVVSKKIFKFDCTSLVNFFARTSNR
jgi:hypothetical protein